MSEDALLWLVVIGAIGATYLWRLLGVLLSRQVNPESDFFQWITCVSYAMLAGLIARMVLLPVGPLTDVSLWIRLAGMAVGLAVFFLLGRRVLTGVGAGLAVFVTLVAYT